MIRTAALIASVFLAAPAAPALAQPFQNSPQGASSMSGSLIASQSSGARALSSRPGSVAVLRGLDKVTARTRDFLAPVGEPVQFGALTITVDYCRRRPPEEPPEVFAFVQVLDRRTDGFGVEDEGERIFSGWMFASSPALNALEHPVYDVWVIDCRS